MESAYDHTTRQLRHRHYALERSPQHSCHRPHPGRAIQRFEFCFELAWKVIQERARLEGLDCQSPKGCLKLAYKNNWITDETGWLAMLEDRNRTAHTYDETLAKDVYRRLPLHLPLLRALNTCLRTTQT